MSPGVSCKLNIFIHVAAERLAAYRPQAMLLHSCRPAKWQVMIYNDSNKWKAADWEREAVGSPQACPEALCRVSSKPCTSSELQHVPATLRSTISRLPTLGKTLQHPPIPFLALFGRTALAKEHRCGHDIQRQAASGASILAIFMHAHVIVLISELCG